MLCSFFSLSGGPKHALPRCGVPGHLPRGKPNSEKMNVVPKNRRKSISKRGKGACKCLWVGEGILGFVSGSFYSVPNLCCKIKSVSGSFLTSALTPQWQAGRAGGNHQEESNNHSGADAMGCFPISHYPFLPYRQDSCFTLGNVMDNAWAKS